MSCREIRLTSFRPWKLEHLALLTVKLNLHTNLLQTIIFSLVSKKLLLNCYISPVLRFPFLSRKGFIYPFLC